MYGETEFGLVKYAHDTNDLHKDLQKKMIIFLLAQVLTFK
jgi:hypothetical protein